MFFIWMTSREPRINSQPASVIVISLKGYKKTVGSIFFFLHLFVIDTFEISVAIKCIVQVI